MQIQLNFVTDSGSILVFTHDNPPSFGPEITVSDFTEHPGWYYVRCEDDRVQPVSEEYPSGPFEDFGKACKDAVGCCWATSVELEKYLK